jgi:hypothetical protein
MKAFWLFILFLGSTVARADSGEKELEGFSAGADVISEDYVAGQFLIYDCKQDHWACVLKEYHDECAEKRNDDLDMGKKHLRCAPLGRFLTKKSCFQRQLYLTGQNHGARFCLSDLWKQREMK